MSVRRWGAGNIPMNDLIFSADGSRVYSTSSRVHEWLLPHLMPLDQMMAQVHRNRYIPDLDCEQQETILFLECEDES
jgi:hypothetical protein